jgi:hypothetical protein
VFEVLLRSELGREKAHRGRFIWMLELANGPSSHETYILKHYILATTYDGSGQGPNSLAKNSSGIGSVSGVWFAVL